MTHWTPPAVPRARGADGNPEIACWNCTLFRHCHPANGSNSPAGQLLAQVSQHRRVVRRGEHVFRPGDAFRYVYIVTSGSLKTYLSNPGQADQIAGFHLAGDVLGLEAVHGDAHPCGACALETSSVCAVPFVRLEELGDVTRQIQRQLLHIMSRRIANGLVQQAVLCRKSADERLAAFLISLSNHYRTHGFSATEFRLSMSRGDIANYLGLAEETVCRLFSRLDEQGLITVNRRSVVLNRLSDLSRMAAMTVAAI
jgi:CRP/FNR family transcriptional regulator